MYVPLLQLFLLDLFLSCITNLPLRTTTAHHQVTRKNRLRPMVYLAGTHEARTITTVVLLRINSTVRLVHMDSHNTTVVNLSKGTTKGRISNSR